MTDRNAPAAGESLPALTCCGERMLWHAMLDKVVCPKCGADVAGQDIAATARLQARLGRPYAPGEKMTDRHPDSVIAQVVEETIERRAKHIATPIAVRSPYAPLPAPTEPAFRLFEQDGALYVDTKHGPVKLTEPLQKSAPAQPGKQWVTPVVCEQPGYNGVFHIEPDPPDLAQRQAARVAEHQRREMQDQPEGGRRDDGFDQHQVDAAKAALLAPAPPRYPGRTR